MKTRHMLGLIATLMLASAVAAAAADANRLDKDVRDTVQMYRVHSQGIQ